jgi:1-acyl-sn-glycerol-3-phosphate acyltransferase
MPALYSLAKVTVAPALAAIWRPKVTGLDNVPPAGPVILASNHRSVIDSVLVPVVVPRQVYYLAKAEYFESFGMRVLMRGLNQVPVNRTDVRAALLALDAAEPVLREGNVLGVYPEGTRSPDGRLYRGRPGAAKLALATGATVVPVGLIGTEKIQPIGARLPRIGPRVDVRFGAPLDLSPWRDRPVDTRVLREITATLMQEIATLTGQESVARYAPRKDSAPLA